MFSTAVIIFRETIEIAMILGVILAATKGMAGRKRWIILGFAGGALGAGLVALFASSISEAASGMGQELFNALILFVAALFIGWTVIWMKTHAREMVAHMKQVGQQVAEGKIPRYSLSLIIALAILREGAEIVMFIYGQILSGQAVSDIVAGSVSGIILGSFAGFMLYISLVKMSVRHMLAFTSWLLVLLVCGLMSQAASFLVAAGYFSNYSHVLWNSGWLLDNNSVAGKALHSLIGYNARPTQVEIITYIITFIVIAGMMKQAGKVNLPKPIITANP